MFCVFKLQEAFIIVSNLRKLIDFEETESIGRGGFKGSPFVLV